VKLRGNNVWEWHTTFERWSAPVSEGFPIYVASDRLVEKFGANRFEALSLLSNLGHQISCVVTLGGLREPFLK
jgi:hypothetical protein